MNNHITDEQKAQFVHKNTSIVDEGTGMRYRQFGGGPCVNLWSVEEIREKLTEEIDAGHEFIGICNHEQYFYPEYFKYQPEMSDKFCIMAKTLHDAGYKFITAEDFE